MAVHNLCLRKNQHFIPKGTISTLGLGLNFCIKSAYPTNNYKKSLSRFKREIRIKYLFRHKPDSGNYVPGLYIPNSEWNPKEASQQVEGCLKKFESKLHQQQKQFQRCYTPPNITPLQASALQHLRNNSKFIIVPSDKNLGFTILK